MGNTHGKKYHELVIIKNESDKTLKMLLDIASKGRGEKNLVKYGKKKNSVMVVAIILKRHFIILFPLIY